MGVLAEKGLTANSGYLYYTLNIMIVIKTVKPFIRSNEQGG